MAAPRGQRTVNESPFCFGCAWWAALRGPDGAEPFDAPAAARAHRAGRPALLRIDAPLGMVQDVEHRPRPYPAAMLPVQSIKHPTRLASATNPVVVLWRAKVRHYERLIESVITQSKWRVLRGEAVPAGDKLVILFDVRDPGRQHH